MATFQVMQRNNKAKIDGTFPIIFKIFLGDKSKIITLPFSCKKDEWDAKKQETKDKIS